jgi:hypothetical protein
VFLLLLAFVSGFDGWFIIAIFVLVLGARHPPPLNDLTKLDLRRYLLGGFAASILVLAFAAVPIDQIPPESRIQFEAYDAPDVPVTELAHNVTRGANATWWFHIVNKGNVRTEVNLTLYLLDISGFPGRNLTVSVENVTVSGETAVVGNGTATFTFDSREIANVTLRIDASAYGPELPPGDWRFAVRATVDGEGLLPKDMEFGLTLGVE